MAGFSLGRRHARSVSLPTRPNRESDRFVVKKFKNLEEIRHGCTKLASLYKDMDQLLTTRLAQKALAHHRLENWVEGWLEESVAFLDMCNATRETVSLIRTTLHTIRSTLTRPIVDRVDLESCVMSLKRLKKDTSKPLRLMSSTLEWVAPVTTEEPHLDQVVGAPLGQASEAGNAIFRSMSRLLCLQWKGRRWPLVGKVLGGHRRDENGEVSDVVRACLAILHGMFRRSHCSENGDNKGEIEVIECVCERLGDLERRMEEVEKEMEFLFKCLIQTRVSFLNVLSH